MLRAVCNIFTGEVSGRSLFYDSAGFCLSGLPRATLRITQVVLPLIIVRHVRCSPAGQQFEWLRIPIRDPFTESWQPIILTRALAGRIIICVNSSNATDPQLPRAKIARQIFGVNCVGALLRRLHAARELRESRHRRFRAYRSSSFRTAGKRLCGWRAPRRNPTGCDRLRENSQ